MTFSTPLKKTLMVALAATAFTTVVIPASAIAKDSAFTVKTTTNGKVRLGVSAFDKGDFEKSVRLNESALKSSLSPKKAAVAHSNICAAYAEMGDFTSARIACDAALTLRPGYEPAVSNLAALPAAE